MNWVDAAIIGIVVVYALTGLRRGFLGGGAEVVSIALGLVVALALFKPIGLSLATARHWRPGIAQGATFVVLWVASQILLSLVARLWLRRLPEETLKGRANRAWGILPAAVKGLVAAALFVTVLSFTRSGSASEDVTTSHLGPPMVDAVITFEKAAYNTFGDALREVQESYGPGGEVDGSRDLSFRTTDAEPDPEAEARMLEMVNAERARNGLSPLMADEALRGIARQHSLDMLAKGYFAHNTPAGVTPFDRMRKARVPFRRAGENLALALTLETAHDRLMRSKGHRDNILDGEYAKVGIGAMRTKVRGTMYTQDFTD